MRPQRSSLAVPAPNRRMIEKAVTLGADQVFLDLEDACAPAEKEAGRRSVVDALRNLDFGGSSRAVRVNDVTTSWCHRDLVEIVSEAGGFLDAVILPKVDDPTQVHFAAHLLDGIEKDVGIERPISLQLQIESPTGAVNLAEIVRATQRTSAVIFGPGDYAAALGVSQIDIGMVDDRYPGHQWHWVMSEIAAHARAAGVLAIDGPYVDFGDERGFRASCLRGRLLGFDGKWCIHPNQVEAANAVFSPTSDELERAHRILRVYTEALERGIGAVAVDGKLVDEATRKAAETVLARVSTQDSDKGPS